MEDETSTFPLTLEYVENNYYNKSITNENLVVEKIDTQINISIDNVGYYGSHSTITATIKTNENFYVTDGTIDFFFIKESDLEQKEYQINNRIINVTDGEVQVRVVPRGEGKIFAKYNGKNTFFKDSQSEEIDVVPQKRLTDIHFIDKNNNDLKAFSIDLEDTLEMKVKVEDVTDVNNIEPVSYGIVTFLHYFIYNMNVDSPQNGMERVIGNPVFLDEDGCGVIRYSPMQIDTLEMYEDAEDEQYQGDLITNVQLIRACYNYDNEAYGEKWNYYHDDSVWGAIFVTIPNSIVITNIYDSNNNQIDVNNAYFSFNRYEPVIINFKVTDDSNNTIEGISENNFIIKDGNNILNDATIQKNGNIFIATINNLDVGMHKIYIETDNEKILRIINNQPYETIIQNKDILKKQSEYLYVSVETKFSSNIELVLTTSDGKNDLTIGSSSSKKLIVNFSDRTNNSNDTNFLQNEYCYFDINNKTYNASINNKKAELLVPTLNQEGDYKIVAYIKAGTYRNGDEVKNLATTYSNTIILKVRSLKEYDTYYKTNNNVFPGEVLYTCNLLKNVSYENFDIINSQVCLKNNNQEYDCQIFDARNRAYQHVFSNIKAGDNYIVTKCVDNNYNVTDNIKGPIHINKREIVLEIPEQIATAEEQIISFEIDPKVINEFNNVNFSINNQSIEKNIYKNYIQLHIPLRTPGNYRINIQNNSNNITICNKDNVAINYLSFEAIDSTPNFLLMTNEEGLQVLLVDYDRNFMIGQYTLKYYFDSNNNSYNTINNTVYTGDSTQDIITTIPYNDYESNNLTTITIIFSKQDNSNIIGYKSITKTYYLDNWIEAEGV